MIQVFYVLLSIILMSVLFMLIIRKDEVQFGFHTDNTVLEPALIDFLKHDFTVSNQNIQKMITQLFEKNILTIEKVALDQNNAGFYIRRVPKDETDILTTLEQHFVDFIIHRCGNGELTDFHHLQAYLSHAENYSLMKDEYSKILITIARHHGFYDQQPTDEGLRQVNFHKCRHVSNLMYVSNLFKVQANKKLEELNVLLALFDQSLSN